MTNRTRDKGADAATVEQLIGLLSPAARRKYLDMQLAQDFGAFLIKVFETVAPGHEFIGNWHIDAMAYAAELIMKGEVKQLITNVPPRHLKSIIYSVALPAFMLGRDPTKRIVCVSYALDLAVKHANDFRSVLNSNWYKRVFPNTRISREKDTQNETMTTARGYRYATSLCGILTGRGADVIILDDPQKPDEALSEAHRKSAASWFDSTLLSRLDSKSAGVIVLVMQRLHEDDLAGYLLEKENDARHHLKIPAIAEEEQRIPIGPGLEHKREVGSVIDPRRESKADLEKLKIKMGSQHFSGQYQQEPIPLEGNLIKLAWFRNYEVTPPFN
jgi:hypothetical protein